MSILSYRKKVLFFLFINLFCLSIIAQSITITSPNGEEFWQVGKTPFIKWESAGLTSSVVLEYSVNNGVDWLPIANVSNTSSSYSWVIPNTISSQCLVRATSNTINDISDSAFEISDDTSSCNIVILGSSTAYGTGATPIENSWVNLYKAAIFQKNTKLNVINLGYPGLTTYQILPTGTTLPDGVSETIDLNRNITKALDNNPTAIIVNMPSNDTDKGYSIASQLQNFETLYTTASNNSVEMWITTTQPRNFTDPAKIQTQIDLKNDILSIYGVKAIDFWSNIADVDGKILSTVDNGDGIHVNNIGHNILFNGSLIKNIDATTCSNKPLSLTEIAVNNSYNLKVFPNPVKDYLLIEFESNNSGELKVDFYDLLGRKLFHKNSDFNFFKKGTNSMSIQLDETTSFHSQFIFGIFTFKTDNNIVQKQIKLFKE